MGNKRHRLKNKRDFENLSKLGRTYFGSNWLVLKVLENHLEFHQLGWTVPKYVGNAVLRNKYKRWLRECLEKQETVESLLSKDKYNLNFIFRRKDPGFYKNLSYEDFNQVIIGTVKKIEAKKKKNNKQK